jgi:hypothetical protein
MELADVCEGCGQLWQRTAMDFPPFVNSRATVFRAELGVLPPSPRDLSHYSQQGAGEGESTTPSPCRPLQQRSGRIPALPYPRAGTSTIFKNRTAR